MGTKNNSLGNKNSKYEFKTLKVRPPTYKKIVRCKTKIESTHCELHSFDSVINMLVDIFLEEELGRKK